MRVEVVSRVKKRREEERKCRKCLRTRKEGRSQLEMGQELPSRLRQVVLAVLAVVWLGIADTRIAGQRDPLVLIN